MVKTTRLDLMQQVIDEKVRILEAYIKSEVEPILNFGTPEGVIGKKFEQWDSHDLMYAKAIFGDGKTVNGKTLDEWIMNKQYKQLLEEEKGVL